jgi:hypothetical protein
MSIPFFCDTLSYASLVISILPVIIGFICFRRFQTYLIPLFLLANVSFILDVVNTIFSEFSENNMPLFHFSSVLEFSLLSFFYYLFYKKYIKRNFMFYSIIGFSIIAFIDYRVNGIKSIDSFSESFESFVFIIYSLFSFLYIMRNMVFENLLAAPFFWVNSAILIYFSGDLLLFVFCNHLERIDYYMMWTIINSVFNIAYSILTSIGFWKTKTQ